MKENDDKPASIFIGTSKVKQVENIIYVTVNFIVKDDVEDFYFTKNENSNDPIMLNYYVTDNKTIELDNYPGNGNERPPQLVFYFDTKPMTVPSYYKYFEMSIVFPGMDVETYKNHYKALDFSGLRCRVKKPILGEQETEKGIIYFPDIKPKL